MNNQNQGSKLQAKPMDEIWEMNIHLNPLDDETKDKLDCHKAQLLSGSDDFVSYIMHTENTRKLKIKQRIIQNELNNFNKHTEK